VPLDTRRVAPEPIVHLYSNNKQKIVTGMPDRIMAHDFNTVENKLLRIESQISILC
jgi:hypothetical protein